MPNMMQDLGADYVDSFYRRAMFRHDNLICQYDHRLDENRVIVNSFDMNATDPRWSSTALENDVFEDMDKFAWPRLGYRDLVNRNMPSAPYYISTTRSAQRGLRPEFMQASAVPVISLLPLTPLGRDYFATAKVAQTILNPTFMSFSEGMAKLRAGEMPGFALSSDVAIALSVSESAEAKFDVLHRERIIGRVDDDDRVVVPTRFFKRTTISNLFEGRVVK